MQNEVCLFYKGYFGSIQSDEDIFYGHILYIDDSISYEAEDIKSIIGAFESVVDDYLNTCTEIGKEPNKTDFNIAFNTKELEGCSEKTSSN